MIISRSACSVSASASSGVVLSAFASSFAISSSLIWDIEPPLCVEAMFPTASAVRVTGGRNVDRGRASAPCAECLQQRRVLREHAVDEGLGGVVDQHDGAGFVGFQGLESVEL